MGWISAAGLNVTGRDDFSARVAKTWSLCGRRPLLGLVIYPHHARFLLDGRNDSRVFAWTLPRLWLAYRLGALRYMIYTACMPPAE